MREAAIDPPRQVPRVGAGRKPPGAAPRSAASSAAIAARRLGGGRAAAARDAEPGLLSRLTRSVSKIKPVKVLAIGAFSVLLVGIVANAVLFQKSRHPAPLLGPTSSHAATSGQGEVAPKVAPVAPVVRAAAAPGPTIADPPQAAPEATPKTVAPKRSVARLQHDDGIGRLLQGGTSSETTAATTRKPDAATLATQRRLVKLGYAVKPDGLMSPATRAAIEKFERDRHLKVGGTMTPALRRAVAAAAAPAAPLKAQ